MREESRKSPRKACGNILRVGTLDSVVDKFLVTNDISVSGCQFESRTPYGVGKTLLISMSFSNRTLKPVSEVVWEKQNSNGMYDIGVKFTSMLPEDEVFLNTLVPNNLPKQIPSDNMISTTATDTFLSDDNYFSFIPTNRVPIKMT